MVSKIPNSAFGVRFATIALALGLVFAVSGCSSSSGVSSGSGTSVADSQAPTDASTPASPSAAPSTPPATPADTTPIEDRKPKPGDDVAVMDTSLGRIVIMFFPDKAKKTVANFETLAKKGFYNGTKFHRVIPGFMIQGGDPNTKTNAKDTWGMGGPGYSIQDEFSDVHHARGIVSMAHSGAPNSGGSQFFIVVKDAGFLDGQYAAFGKVVSGMDVADKIVNVPVVSKSQPGRPPQPGDDRPKNPPVIKSVKIEKWPVK